MTRLEWKVKRHRARVFDRYWHSLNVAQHSALLSLTHAPLVQRFRPRPPSSILTHWEFEKQALGRQGLVSRVEAIRSLMRANLAPFRFW